MRPADACSARRPDGRCRLRGLHRRVARLRSASGQSLNLTLRLTDYYGACPIDPPRPTDERRPARRERAHDRLSARCRTRRDSRRSSPEYSPGRSGMPWSSRRGPRAGLTYVLGRRRNDRRALRRGRHLPRRRHGVHAITPGSSSTVRVCGRGSPLDQRHLRQSRANATPPSCTPATRSSSASSTSSCGRERIGADGSRRPTNAASARSSPC